MYGSPMIRRFVPAASDFRALLELGIPIVIVQVGLMLMGVVDNIFVGHVSGSMLAAVALGNLYFFGLTMPGFGVLLALDPIVAQAVGAKDAPAVARGIQRGLLLAALISVPAMLACLPAEPIFRLLRQPPEVVPTAAAFVRMSAPGALPFFVFVVTRLSLQAMKHMRPVLVTIAFGNLVNAALNWVFVFGHLGSPRLGAVGSALSSVIGRWCMASLLVALAWRELKPQIRPWHRESLQLGPLLRTVAIGLPIGIQFLLEFGAFAVIAILAGWFGASAMAGHQVAINLASFTFMVPLGVSSAAAVLVGHAVGENDPEHARRLARTALACGGSFMMLTAVAMLAAPALFASVYTSSSEVIAVAVALIPIAGVFQVFDGLQVVAAGILRGVGDTRAPMLANVLAFWIVGMPVSLWLGFHQRLGVVGLWWGFVAALAAVALFLMLRVRVRLNRTLARLHVEELSMDV